MKPVLVIRHASLEVANYLIEFLSQQHIPTVFFGTDTADHLPDNLNNYSGLVLMGSLRSVNDKLAWMDQLLVLIREAFGRKIPILGHCLGAQLMSKALGGQVTHNTHPEIGWIEVQVLSHPIAKRWFGAIKSFNGFLWHGDTFSLPLNSISLLSSRHCKHQAFALGKHLGLQCHLEMNTELVKSWCETGANDIRSAVASPAVQTQEQILSDLTLRCFLLQKVARQVYGQWIQGLKF